MPQIIPLWTLIVERLPNRCPETEFYTLTDIAPLLGVKKKSLGKHAARLWPHHRGHWRLDYADAQRLIRYGVACGRNVHKIDRRR